MKEFIIVWFDNIDKDFNNDHYRNESKSDAIKQFYNNHNCDVVLINIIEL